MVGQRSGELIDQIHGRGEEGLDAVLAGMISQGQTDMRFSCTRRPHEDGIFLLFDEMKIKETEDLRLIDCFWEGEIEGIQGFGHGEIGLSETGFNPALLPGSDFMRG